MFKQEVLLSKYSSYKIGGPAKFFYEARSFDQLVKAVRQAREESLPIFILGGGTNLVFNDRGFDGLVLKPKLLTMETQSPVITAHAGVLMSDLLEFALENGLSGLEWAGGLPGTLGGAVRGNAGAFKGEIKDLVQEVASLGIADPELKVIRRTNPECRFGYRTSIFKENDGKEIILSVTLNMKQGDKKAIKEAMEEKINYRKDRHPIEYPNVGSIFKNVPVAQVSGKIRPIFQHVIKTDPFPVIPTAYLIAQAGLKGVSCGGAMISPKHPNFIVNVLDAKASDVKTLAELTKSTVKQKFGIQLEEEVIYVGS